ncbi:hypothetical protein CTA1_4598 [Colletotrichum tanaceti]|uniref:Uncharacterized protein n=1 Tax=Colletotrichum tanaceti TaxID=1306861 RepID=A0A4U6XFJ6_9PEZI|nr:hypothetical protein CTA1_4598 [Colletotrichum tanaceti]
MFDPIASILVVGTLAMTSVYGSYVYWITHGPTLDEWRERELAADRRRLRQAIREENRAADAALKEAEYESEKKST